MPSIKDIVKTTAQSLTSLDLRDEVAACDSLGREVPQIARVWLNERTETAEVIYWPALGRGACVSNGDAVWTDASSLRDVAERVLVAGKVVE